MPIKIRKLPGIDRYRVRNGKEVTAFRTTRKKAEKQARLLRAVKHGWKPTGKVK